MLKAGDHGALQSQVARTKGRDQGHCTPNLVWYTAAGGEQNGGGSGEQYSLHAVAEESRPLNIWPEYSQPCAPSPAYPSPAHV